MANSNCRLSLVKRLLPGIVLLVCTLSLGCSVSTSGDTTPTGVRDDVQYFPPGPEFPLQNEEAARKLREAEAKAQRAARR